MTRVVHEIHALSKLGRMTQALFPVQYLLAAAALWLNRQQQSVIDY